MKDIFVSSIKINNVRHLSNIQIDLSEKDRKHLIITGKNGSGKTSLLNAIAIFLNSISSSNDPMEAARNLRVDEKNLENLTNNNQEVHRRKTLERILAYRQRIERATAGVILELNCDLEDVKSQFTQGNFVVAYYQADRVFSAKEPKHVEKVSLRSDYLINEKPREDFIKYLLDLKMTEALAISNKKMDKAEKIKRWFEQFEDLLKKIFEDESVQLEFDEDTFKFQILMDGRKPFDFNTLSSGYAAVLDIVVDLIIRMEKQMNKVFDFSIPGIVLIDEIETHLHLELQKKILELLITIFPNIQFIVSTHSPFILNSLENVTIYDLEKKLLVKDGLADVPYGGIVEGYFDADLLSSSLREKYERYKVLAKKEALTDDDFEEISELEMYLEEIPDYLAIDITTEYQRLKMELRNREDF